jgi:hypothetical protein
VLELAETEVKVLSTDVKTKLYNFGKYHDTPHLMKWVKMNEGNWRAMKSTTSNLARSTGRSPRRRRLRALPRDASAQSLVAEEPEARELNDMGDSQTGPQSRIPSLVLVVWQEH